MRDFKIVGEINEVRNAVLEVEATHDALSAKLRCFFLRRAAGEKKTAPYAHTLFSLLATMYARFLLGGKVNENPVHENEIPAFLKRAFIQQESRIALDRESAAWFLDTLAGGSAKTRARLLPLWERVLHEVESELGRLSDSRSVDSRFVTVLRVFPRKKMS